MMDRTDRHYRWFARCITRRTLLYTEMVTTGAILFAGAERFLDHDPAEHPLAVQLGGDDPDQLARAAVICEQFGYDEINLNVGCPSDRVQRGRFGACLMLEPEHVARCVAAMREAVGVPVTVKHRIGVDERDAYDDLLQFVDTVSATGAARFSVHARKAWLSGLSPRDNRTVPPLRYPDVYRLKRERPHLEVEINGGIESLAAAREHLAHVDAVMIGRAAYERPWILAAADQELWGDPHPPVTRRAVVERMLAYVERQRAAGVYLGRITRHMLGLFAGLPGARAWRRILSEEAYEPGAGPEVLERALAAVPDEVLDGPVNLGLPQQ